MNDVIDYGELEVIMAVKGYRAFEDPNCDHIEITMSHHKTLICSICNDIYPVLVLINSDETLIRKHLLACKQVKNKEELYGFINQYI